MEGTKDGSHSVRDGRHHFDEDVEGDADYVFAGVADGVASDGGFMRGGAFGDAGESTAFDELLGVVEGTTGITHENSARNSDDGSTDQESAHEFGAKEDTADNRNQ